MAYIRIQTAIKAQQFSCNIPDEIVFETDLSIVKVSLVDGSAKEIIKLSLDSYNNKVVLFDLKSVVEQYMLDNGLALCNFALHAEGEEAQTSVPLSILYCAYNTTEDIEDFVENFFLTSLQFKRTFKHIDEHLSFYASDTIAPTIAVTASDGEELKVFNLSPKGYELNARSVNRIDICYDALMEEVKKVFTQCVGILSATANVGARSFTFFFADAEPEVVFSFRNEFNCIETCAVEGITKRTTKAERSDAVSNGLMVYYDQKDTLTIEFDSAPLLSFVADWLSQIATSREVYEGSSVPILITDHSFEITDRDDELNTVKFSYIYRNKRPSFATPANKDRIFTQEYTIVYT